MHIVQTYRPLQVGFNSRVLEQNRRFFFVVSATLGINLQSGRVLLDVDFLKDAFESMGDNPTPEVGMPKPRGEFIVTGSYFAPEGQAVTGGEVKVCLGEKEKSLYVFGPRRWGANGLSSRPEPVTTLSIDYFHAFGGEKYDKNPDGIGLDDGRLPCVENPHKLVTSPDDRPEPAGLAPLALDCPQRMRFKGTYDGDYKKKYFPGYPEDFNWHYFLNAPEDQWATMYYQGNESFEIYNMHPDQQLVKGKLPDLYARAFIRHTIDSAVPAFGELPLNLDTIWFFPEKLLGLLVFRGVTEVADDEAEQVSDVLLCYEDRGDQPRSLEHYRRALERRKTGENPFLNYFQTQDLIPPGTKTALDLFQERGEVELDHSSLSQNIQARTDEAKKMMDEKIEEAVRETEKSMADLDLPEDGRIDVKEIIKTPPESASDPDVDEFIQKLEAIMPGITSGEAGKLDLNNFPFDKIGEIGIVAEEMGKKKEAQARDMLKEELRKAREQIVEQVENLKNSDQEMPDALQDTLDKLEKRLADLDGPAEGKAPKDPLPRLNAREIIDQVPKNISPESLAAMQHLQAMKAMGIEDETVKALEKQVQEHMTTAVETIEKPLYEMEAQFITAYHMGAHFMAEGLSPHEEPVETIKERFLQAVANKESVAAGDWACLDLSGENLDNIDLSRTFLEQVDFSGASLKGANLSGAILARANLSGADFSGANLQGANVGAVIAENANFSRADLKGAKLSRGDFTRADFTEANLEEVESLYFTIDSADFTRAVLPGLQILETKMRGTCFAGADLYTAFFMMSSLEDVDFTGAIMNRCLFANVEIKNTCFDQTEFCGGCFAGTDAEQAHLEGLSFRGAILHRTNFQRMLLQNADFSSADLEYAYFESADLSGADLSRAQARYAQFRSADLTGARLDGINLMEGSLAKARLVNASLKGANLFRTDFLRSTITNTDFRDSNLDDTLIEHWRPA